MDNTISHDVQAALDRLEGFIHKVAEAIGVDLTETPTEDTTQQEQ